MVAAINKSREYQDIFHWAETQQNGTIPSFGTRKNDPYQVQIRCSELVMQTADFEIVPIRIQQQVSFASMTWLPRLISSVFNQRLYQELCRKDRTVREMCDLGYTPSR